MARPKEFDVDSALDRATELFWQRGYEGTSVQDLVDALGVNRASLYSTFGDKAQLFKAVLERYQGWVTDSLGRTLGPPASGLEALRAFFAVLISQATRKSGARGCLVLNTVTGGVTAPVELQERARAAMTDTTEQVRQALARDPSLAGRRDLPELARFFAAEGHGLALLARAGVPARDLDRAAEVALSVLDPVGHPQRIGRPRRPAGRRVARQRRTTSGS